MAAPKKIRKPLHFYKNEKWDSACRHFVESLTNPITKRTYSETLLRLIAFVEAKYGSPRTPDKFVQEDIEEFLAQPTQKGRNKGQPPSAYTHNSYFNVIRTFYIYCSRTPVVFRGKKVPLMRKDWIPTDGISLRETGDVDRDMTEAELKAFFVAIPRETTKGKRDFALFWALFITGRRRFEITLLRRKDLEQYDFDDGRRGWRFWFRGKRRVVKEWAEMPASVMAAITDFHRAAGRDFMTMPPEQALFPGDIARQSPMGLNWVGGLFKKYAKKAGLPGNSVPHSLRWENAYQRYIQTGKDLIKVQEEMGWKDASMAAHYIRRRRRKQSGDTSANSIADKFAIL